MQLEVGDILLVRGRTWVSPIVKAFLNSPYSHAAIVVGPDLICDIDIFQKMQFRKLPGSWDFDQLRMKEGLTASEQLQIGEFLQDKCATSKGYDWGRVASILLRRLFAWEIIIDERNEYICSEIVDAAYNFIGIDLLADRDPGDATPADFASCKMLIQYS